MAKPCFSFPSSSEQNSVRDNREKTVVICIPTSITQKLPLRRYAFVDLHWKHTRFNSLKRTRRSTRTRIRFAKSTNSNDQINEIYLLSRRTSTPLSCLRASSMLSLSRVEITVKTKDDYVYVYMYIPMTERVRARETWHFFGSKNLCRGSRGGGNLKAPVDSFFSFSKRCSSQGLRMRTEDPCDRATAVRLERRHREFRQSDCASLPTHPHCAWRFGNCADFSSQSYKTSLPRSAGTSNPWSTHFRMAFIPFHPLLFYWRKFGSFEIANNRIPISQ